MHAFILAGGFATRLWPLTEKRAKPLLPLAGKPMLTHIVEKIPTNIAITISTNAAFEDDFKEWAAAMDRSDISIVIEQTETDDQKLGTNGAVAQWIKQSELDDDLLLLTGDNYLGFSMNEFLASAKPNTPLLAAYDINNLSLASSFGTVLTADDGEKVEGFEEKPKVAKTTLVSTGCYFMPRSCISILVEYAKDHPDHIGGIFEEFLRKNIPVTCFRFSEYWFDIGSYSSYIDATKKLIGHKAIIDPSATVTDVEMEGSVVIGKNCSVKESTLEDTVLFGNCTLEDCILRDCIIDEHCTLKGVDLTGKMVRGGTILEKY